MEVTTVSTVISVVLGVICAPCGLFLGLVPMKAGLVTAKQSKASQMVSFIVAKIPALHAWALHKWPFFEPKKAAPAPKRVKKAKKK